MYQVWVWVNNHYEMRYAGKSRVCAVLALWVFAGNWDSLKLIKKPLN